MSSVCVLTPVVIGAWPMIAAAAASVAASMGLAVSAGETIEIDEAGTNVRKRVVTEVPNSEVLEEHIGHEERIVLSRDGLDIEITRGGDGAVKLCVTGEHSKAELERIGQEIAGKLVQQYAYHRLVTELRERRYEIVEESLQKDQSIQMRVRLSH